MSKVRFDRDDLGSEVLYAQQRNDVSELKPAGKTREGFLKVEGRIGSVGVFRYKLPDGTVLNELRPPDEVFDSQTLESFSGVPLTLEHPMENGQRSLISPANAKQFTVGTVSHPQRVGSHAVASLVIHDEAAIAAAENGKTKLSGGYTADVYLIGGEFTDDDGQSIPFNAVQRKIRGNHVAITDRPRAGPSAEFRMDSAQFDGEAEPMAKKTITIAGVQVEVEESKATQIEAAQKAATQAKLDSADEGKASKEVTELKGVIAGLTARLDSKDEGEEKEKEAEQKKAAMKSHAALAVSASKHLDTDVDELLDLEPVDIQKKVIERLSPDFKFDSDDPGYIGGVYAGFTAKAPESKKTGGKKPSIVDKLQQPKHDDADDDDDGEEFSLGGIYAERQRLDSEAWKPKAD